LKVWYVQYINYFTGHDIEFYKYFKFSVLELYIFLVKNFNVTNNLDNELDAKITVY